MDVVKQVKHECFVRKRYVRDDRAELFEQFFFHPFHQVGNVEIVLVKGSTVYFGLLTELGHCDFYTGFDAKKGKKALLNDHFGIAYTRVSLLHFVFSVNISFESVDNLSMRGEVSVASDSLIPLY